MVKDFSMSDRVGLRTFEEGGGQLLGGPGDSLGVSTKENIDEEISRLLNVSTESVDCAVRGFFAVGHFAMNENVGFGRLGQIRLGFFFIDGELSHGEKS